MLAMAKKGLKAGKAPVRSISTKQDYERASAVVERLSGEIEPDSAAELRLKGLLREMDKFEDGNETASTDDLDEYEYSGPRRRWSDEASDVD
jgi:hypothetical protein